MKNEAGCFQVFFVTVSIIVIENRINNELSELDIVKYPVVSQIVSLSKDDAKLFSCLFANPLEFLHNYDCTKANYQLTW